MLLVPKPSLREHKRLMGELHQRAQEAASSEVQDEGYYGEM